MHVIMAWLAGTLISIVGTLAGRVLLALGIGLTSYVGINASLYIFKSYFVDYLSSAGWGIIGLAGVLKLDICMSMLIATGMAKFVINGVNNLSLMKFTFIK